MSSTHDSSYIAESVSSSKPFLRNNSTNDNATTSADMSDVNGKAPVNGASNGASHANEPVIKVQPPRREDLQPSYARVIQPDDADADTNGWYGGMINTLGGCIGTLGAIPCCIVCPNPYKPVSQGNVGLVTKFGRFARAVDPGLVYVNPLSEQLTQVDIKIQIVEVPKQVCMTKDNVSLQLTSVIYYRITSPHKAAFSISNIRQALVERTQTTLRHVVGARVLQDVIERREEIAQSIREIIEETALGWGVEVESMLVKDIIFSQDLQDSLSMAAQSKRTGEAKVIAARAEVEAAKLMRQAADILSSAPAMQIRYLEAMQAMAKSANSKVIFLPAQNQTVQSALAQAESVGEGPSAHGASSSMGVQSSAANEYGGNNSGFQSAINSHVIENM
ncbi:stomatin family protein-like protein [Stemphylium lycopersici]|uniref:Stomatin family protein-like protein n=1 Tax=Stemphylium lycopersici TaxID=183478 RepID=A0A364N8P0_STELY|nr:stomatin family protein [Stemphylium lycopersici]RAR06353.1 stomatin family protein-like protein [Stemphylium lycopersici]RAR13652.1 stomatin family protein-like protein [Stemphylium lycopersici]